MKTFLLLLACSIAFCNYSTGQILCILCYDQNDSISLGVNNLLLNGGFEDTPCVPSTGVIGTPTSFCPNSDGYSCDFPNWTCTGGGSDTYACLYDILVNKSIIVQGTNAVYFGNFYCGACSPNIEDTSCLVNVDCAVTGIPFGYPVNPDIAFGGATGVSLEQTANNLIPGHSYVLEFWAGGEQYYSHKGLFAVDVGFGDTLLRNKSTGPGETGTTFIIQFKATSPSHTIKFTNWGHICFDCTELVLDNVRLYALEELNPSIPPCIATIVSFGASNTDLCEKFCISYFDSSTNNPTSWQWIFPGGDPSSSTDQNPANICYDIPGTYDVTLITTNANGIDTLTLNNYITVYPTPPFPTMTQVGYTLTSSPASSYQWQFNSVDIPGATDQSYTVLQTGYYTVVVGDSNGCKNSFTEYVLISGISETESDANISVYPNPSAGNFTVEFLNEMSSGEVSIDVMNTLGQKVFSSTGTSEGILMDQLEKKEIDLHHLAGGVYFIGIKTQKHILQRKIIMTK